MKSHYRVVVIGGGVVGASSPIIWPSWAGPTSPSWSAACSRRVPAGTPPAAFTPSTPIPTSPRSRPTRSTCCRRSSRSPVRAIGMHMTGGISFASHAGALGVAAVDLSHLPDHGHRGRPADRARRNQGTLSDHQHRRHLSADSRPTAKAISTRPASCMPMPRRARRRGAEVIEHNRVSRSTGARRRLGRRHRAGHHHCRARRQCRRPLGQAGRPDGRASSFRCRRWSITIWSPRAIPKLAALDTEVADDGRSRRLHLYAPGAEGHAARHLRDQPQALEHGRRPLGLRLRAHPAGRRSHRRRTRDGFIALSAARDAPASSAGSTAPSPSTPDGNPLVGPVRGAARTTGSPAG